MSISLPFIFLTHQTESDQLINRIISNSQYFYDKESSLLIIRNKNEIYFIFENDIRKSKKCNIKSKMYK